MVKTNEEIKTSFNNINSWYYESLRDFQDRFWVMLNALRSNYAKQGVTIESLLFSVEMCDNQPCFDTVSVCTVESFPDESLVKEIEEIAKRFEPNIIAGSIGRYVSDKSTDQLIVEFDLNTGEVIWV